MVFIIFLRKGSVRHGIYFEGSAREKRLRNAGLDSGLGTEGAGLGYKLLYKLVVANKIF